MSECIIKTATTWHKNIAWVKNIMVKKINQRPRCEYLQMAENIQLLEKDMIPHIEKAHGVPSRIKKNKSISRHILVKLHYAKEEL